MYPQYVIHLKMFISVPHLHDRVNDGRPTQLGVCVAVLVFIVHVPLQVVLPVGEPRPWTRHLTETEGLINFRESKPGGGERKGLKCINLQILVQKRKG